MVMSIFEVMIHAFWQVNAHVSSNILYHLRKSLIQDKVIRIHLDSSLWSRQCLDNSTSLSNRTAPVHGSF
jgi:hypothetical protein